MEEKIWKKYRLCREVNGKTECTKWWKDGTGYAYGVIGDGSTANAKCIYNRSGKLIYASTSLDKVCPKTN